MLRALTRVQTSLRPSSPSVGCASPSVLLPAALPLLRSFERTKKYTPKGNFSPKRGNRNFYKGKGDAKYGKKDARAVWTMTKVPPYSVMSGLDTFGLKPYVEWAPSTPAKAKRPGGPSSAL